MPLSVKEAPDGSLRNAKRAPIRGRPLVVVLEEPGQQNDDDNERNETAADVHSGLLCLIDAGTTAEGGEGLRRGRYDGAAAPWPSG